MIDAQELIIDLFAGGGGASEGILMATGRHPDIAVNHDEQAIALHAVNHPSTLHLCEDIRKVNIPEVLARFGNRRVGILWASPDCKHHSKAAGGRPKDKNIRGLAWEVLRWAAAIKRSTGHLPRLIALENVEEYTDWCPLHRYGKRAGQMQKRRKGETFKLWVENLRSLGFRRIEWRELVAADRGVPTTRKRLYLVAMSEDYEADWPEATHAPRTKGGVQQGSLFDLAKPLEPYVAAADIIDWDRPIPSIFGRKKELQPKTKARIAKGVRRYVIERKPFIVPITHTGPRAVPTVDEPLRTITSANRGEHALVAPHITKFRTGAVGHDMETPLHTVTANSYAKRPGGAPPLGVAAAFLQKMNQNGIGTPMTDPLVTAMAGAARHYEVAAYLEQANTRDVGASADHPVRTVTGKGHQGLVAAYLGRQFGSTVSGRDLRDPAPTIMTDGGGGKSQLVAPLIDKYYGSGVAADPTDPLDTATAKARFGLGAAYMEQANTGMVGRSLEDPIATIVAGGDSGWGTTQRLVQARLERIEAEDGVRRRQVLEFLWEHFGHPTAEEWADPMATAQGRLRFGLVIVDGVALQIVDIGMRMLIPRELYRAQGFRDTYQIEIVFKGKPLTKTAQIRMAGNSVCPKMAADILTAFMPPALKSEAMAA